MPVWKFKIHYRLNGVSRCSWEVADSLEQAKTKAMRRAINSLRRGYGLYEYIGCEEMRITQDFKGIKD